MSSRLVITRIDNGVATVRMDDPGSHNALSRSMVAELEGALTAVSRSSDARVVVIEGLPDYFCSGASREVLDAILDGGVDARDLLLPRTVLDVPKPVIAAMEGHAIGGGLALGLCADIVLVARESRYGANFMNYGFTPVMGITMLLEYAIGPMLGHELLLTGELVKGAEFQHRGGFSRVVEKREVLSRAHEIATRIAEKPPEATSVLKTVLSARKRAMFESARASEITMHKLTFREETVRHLIREEFGGLG